MAIFFIIIFLCALLLASQKKNKDFFSVKKKKLMILYGRGCSWSNLASFSFAVKEGILGLHWSHLTERRKGGKKILEADTDEKPQPDSRHAEFRKVFFFFDLPNHERWHAKWNLSRNTYTLHTRFLHVLVPTCMLSQCLLAKFLHRSSVRSLLKVHCRLGRNTSRT